MTQNPFWWIYTNRGEDYLVTIMPKTSKINEQELILYLGQGLTHEQIAQKMGVSRPAITKAVGRLPQDIMIKADIKEFRLLRADAFAQIQQSIINIMKMKLAREGDKISLNQLGTLFGILYDKERLEQGKATEHIAHATYKQLTPEDRKMLRDFINQRTKRIVAESDEENKDDNEI
jgi:biotin operon repressor